MREFVTAVEEEFDETDSEEGSPLSLDGETYTYFKPSDGQLAIYMAQVGRHSNVMQQVGATVDLFIELFDEESKAKLVSRLMDREDPFGVEMVKEIMSAMVEEWGGRPTKPSTVSTRSRKNGGRSSTRRTPVSV